MNAPQAPDYEWDVFVSFSRYERWPVWVQQHFMPLLKHWLGAELRGRGRFFIDSELKAGQNWPHELGNALARSKVLVPLLSADYFASPWCTAEYKLMEEREAAAGGDTTLIVPALVHDGESLPAPVLGRQRCKLVECVRTHMPPNTQLAADFEAAIQAWAPEIADAIRSAPPWDPGWPASHVAAMESTFGRTVHIRKSTWA